MKYEALTVGELKNFFEKYSISDQTKIIIMENDTQWIYSKSKECKKKFRDSFEGLRLCNIGGLVYNKYENENGVVLGFSYDYTFENAMDLNPTAGCKIISKITN